MDNVDDFPIDKPWSPLSYFEEEESEGQSCCTYSANHLASLFETNIKAVDLDIEKAKQSSSLQQNDGVLVMDSTNDDNLSHYTLETDAGIKVLDTTYSINRKAIFHDFDRLKRFRESIDKPDFDDENIDDLDLYTYQMSPPASDSIERLMNELPVISGLATDRQQAEKRMIELERRLSEGSDLLPLQSCIVNSLSDPCLNNDSQVANETNNDNYHNDIEVNCGHCTCENSVSECVTSEPNTGVSATSGEEDESGLAKADPNTQMKNTDVDDQIEYVDEVETLNFDTNPIKTAKNCNTVEINLEEMSGVIEEVDCILQAADDLIESVNNDNCSTNKIETHISETKTNDNNDDDDYEPFSESLDDSTVTPDDNNENRIGDVITEGSVVSFDDCGLQDAEIDGLLDNLEDELKCESLVYPHKDVVSDAFDASTDPEICPHETDKEISNGQSTNVLNEDDSVQTECLNSMQTVEVALCDLACSSLVIDARSEQEASGQVISEPETEDGIVNQKFITEPQEPLPCAIDTDLQFDHEFIQQDTPSEIVNRESDVEEHADVIEQLLETPDVMRLPIEDSPNDLATVTDDVVFNDSSETAEMTPAECTASRPVRHVRFSFDHEENQEAQAGETAATPETVSTSQTLGLFAPTWIPDVDAKTCMKCDLRFTVVKRRHHCRACGKVLCATCCNMKCNLPYMDNKSVRVCQTCFDIMLEGVKSQPDSVLSRSTQLPPSSVLPEAPPPYSELEASALERTLSNSSEVPPYQEAHAGYSEHPVSIVIPPSATGDFNTMSPLNMPDFPNILSTTLPAYSVQSGRQRQMRNRSESEMSAVIMFNSTVTNLPPILRKNNNETRIVNNPNLTGLFHQIHDYSSDPVSFIVNKNLVVKVKVVNMSCCVEKRSWCFMSDGMGASNQEEVVVLVSCDSTELEDAVLTRKLLQQMNFIFEKAKHGHPVADFEQIEFDSSMMCTPNNAGMMFFKPTLQCQKNLLIPTSPYIFGLYICSSEIPWAKNFPLRLLLRIGAEFKYYPCPLFNALDRKTVYEGIGLTILELLADFRNFQYTIPRVPGVTINLKGKDTILKLPQHRLDEVLKHVNASEDNVLSFAGNFSSTCDGHLVSVEKDGRYKTQTLSIVLKENRKVTCASFIVISAALKENSEDIRAKASIVEDGVMVQVTSDVMKEIKKAIKDMKEYHVTAGDPTVSSEEKSVLSIEWCATETADRPKLSSPIDGTLFDNLTNMKIRHSYDYTSSTLTAKIHWVEVYFLPQDNDTVQRLSARELGQMTSSIAKACMSALSPHLSTLIVVDMTRIGLRINLAADFVEYQIGASLTTLPAELLPILDDKLVPAIHSVMTNAQERVAVELIFQVVQIV